MRAFIGIGLPDGVRASLARLQGELGEAGADVKWTAPALLHVTLKFLDEISGTQRQAVDTLLQRVAFHEPAFTFGIEGVGAFPSVQAPRVVWVGLSEGREAVVRIAQAIEREAQPLGLCCEGRPFSPHLTLGRVRTSRQLAELSRRLSDAHWVAPPPWRVSSLTLYQSVLGANGPVYTVLGEFPLTA